MTQISFSKYTERYTQKETGTCQIFPSGTVGLPFIGFDS